MLKGCHLGLRLLLMTSLLCTGVNPPPAVILLITKNGSLLPKESFLSRLRPTSPILTTLVSVDAFSASTISWPPLEGPLFMTVTKRWPGELSTWASGHSCEAKKSWLRSLLELSSQSNTWNRSQRSCRSWTLNFVCQEGSRLFLMHSVRPTSCQWVLAPNRCDSTHTGSDLEKTSRSTSFLHETLSWYVAFFCIDCWGYAEDCWLWGPTLG